MKTIGGLLDYEDRVTVQVESIEHFDRVDIAM
jgi:hypothetical protein